MTNENQISISQKGFQTSYRRYLSDSAPGFLVILLFLLAQFSTIEVANQFALFDVNALQDSHALILVSVIIFLLATPIGIMLNAVGWFLLGGPGILLLRIWARRSFFFNWSTNLSANFDQLQDFFNLNHKDFYYKGNIIQEIIKNYYPQVKRDFGVITGARRFVRSMALIAIFLIFLIPSYWLTLLLITVICIVVMSLFQYYNICNFFKIAYFLSMKGDHEQLKGDFDQIVDYLIKAAN